MLIVKKFGGTSVANKERIFNVANRCIEEYRKGNDVVVVLSAMGKYTDELITMARDVNEKPPKREMDMLFTIGEQMSVALMAMAMDKLGVPAVSLNAFQVSMHTTSSHGNARLKRIRTEQTEQIKMYQCTHSVHLPQDHIFLHFPLAEKAGVFCNHLLDNIITTGDHVISL